MHDAHVGLAAAGRQRLHKRARASTSAAATDGAAQTTGRGRGRAAAKTTTAATDVLDTVATASSLLPGAAATGIATKLVANTPPTRSRDLNSGADSSSYATTFAGVGNVPGASLSSGDLAGTGASATQNALAASSSPGAGALPQATLIAIIAAAAGGGALIIAVIVGVCCWKKRKAAKKAEEAVWGGTIRGFDAGAGDSPGGKGEAWESTDDLAYNAAPPGGGQWAQSTTSLATSYGGGGGEKYGHFAAASPIPALPHVLSGGQSLEAARAELFASRPSINTQEHRSNTPRSGPSFAHEQQQRSNSPSSFTSSAPPFQPAPTPYGYGRQRTQTDAHSVVEVISFSGGGPPGSGQYPPPGHASSIYPPSTSFGHPLSQAHHHPLQQQQHPPPPSQAQPAFAAAPVVPTPQPILSPSYPPIRPPRPSEVPAFVPPFAPSQRDERRDTVDTQQRDEDVQGRWMEVMTGRVGVDDEEEEQEVEREKQREQARRKKDTIAGLAEAYAGGGEQEWEEVDLPSAIPAIARPDLPQRASSKRGPPPASQPAPPVPTLSASSSHAAFSSTSGDTDEIDSFPLPPSSPLPPNPAPAPAAKGKIKNRYSTRIDSRPLRDLESYLEKMPAPPGVRSFPRARVASEASDISSAFSLQQHADMHSHSRTSVASSFAPLAHPRRAVPPSGSKDSLAPVPNGGPGAQHSPYGHPERYEVSIYSAAGEVGELSSASSSGGSPMKPLLLRPGLSSSGSFGTQGSERLSPLGMRRAASSGSLAIPEEDEEGDVFSAAPPASSSSEPRAPQQLTTRPPPPAPLRLARSASLANHSPLSSALPPSPAPPPSMSPPSPPPSVLTMSAAERDVLNQLGLPSPSPSAFLAASGASSFVSHDGERTPDLTRSIASGSTPGSPDTSMSFSVSTPLTPSFPSLSVGPSATSSVDVLSTPTLSPTPFSKPSFAAQQQSAKSRHLDPLSAAGFDPTQTLAGLALQAQDPSYRSATLSIYGMYD
ncbi:hypothetical protein JCM10213v2_001950 [Rhodosporidiobolus nylandii]